MSTHTPDNCPINERMDKLEKAHQRRHRLAQVMFDSDMIATRVTLALAELLWGINLLWPGDTFSRPTYSVMSHFAVEEVWGLIFVLTSWVQWNIVMIGDCRSIYARLFAGWNASLWVFVNTAMYLSVYPPPAAISGETALAAAATWILLRPTICTLSDWCVRRKRNRGLAHD